MNYHLISNTVHKCRNTQHKQTKIQNYIYIAIPKYIMYIQYTNNKHMQHYTHITYTIIVINGIKHKHKHKHKHITYLLIQCNEYDIKSNQRKIIPIKIEDHYVPPPVPKQAQPSTEAEYPEAVYYDSCYASAVAHWPTSPYSLYTLSVISL